MAEKPNDRMMTSNEAGTYILKEASGEEAQKANYQREMEMLIQGETGKSLSSFNRDSLSQDEMAAKLKQGGLDGQAFDMTALDQDLIQILSEQQGMDYVDLANYQLGAKEVLSLIPAEIAMSYKCLPIQMEEDGSLLVAIADPLNVQIPDDLQLLTNKPIRTVVANEDDLVEFITMHYGMGDQTIEGMVRELEDEGDTAVLTKGQEIDLSNLEEIAAQAPVIKLANIFLLQAIKDRASDLHVEPFTNTLRIRYRVDGLLREIPPPPKSLQVGLLSRFKIMANLDISETRRPQDGRIKLTLEGREVDLRVSTLPTVHGESIVMRILDKQMMMVGINQLGMSKGGLVKFKKEIRKPNGIVLVTGPTGCGKTTTLYAGLSEINDPGDKIITTEDPVEYEVPGLIQVNINASIGLTFEACLRAILRQDPDIILVGEIRDVATAQISIQASLTGHLVFSTLHTNSAAATITRLVDMGIEPFLLTSTLEAIVGQRLVRTICSSCMTEYLPTDFDLRDFMITPETIKDLTFKIGKGCEECQFTGYKGRIGLFELMLITDGIRELILQRESQEVITAASLQDGMSTMRRDGWTKICMGLTSFEEVSRSTPKDSEENVELEMKNANAKTKQSVGDESEEQPLNVEQQVVPAEELAAAPTEALPEDDLPPVTGDAMPIEQSEPEPEDELFDLDLSDIGFSEELES